MLQDRIESSRQINYKLIGNLFILILLKILCTPANEKNSNKSLFTLERLKMINLISQQNG